MKTKARLEIGFGRVTKFCRDESGSLSVEFMILLPIFTVLLLLVTDASLLFLRQTTLMNVARDTARAVARHAMSVSEAQAYAQRLAATKQSSATATITVNDGVVTVVVSASAQTAAPFGIVRFAVGDRLLGAATNVMEPV